MFVKINKRSNLLLYNWEMLKKLEFNILFINYYYLPLRSPILFYQYLDRIVVCI